jgi:hypothetical protein
VLDDALLSLTGGFLLPEESSPAAWKSLGSQLMWLLRQAGSLGAIIYVVRIALNTLIATSTRGLSALANSQTLLHVLALDELGKLLHSHGYVIVLPLLAAAVLVAAAQGVSFIGWRLGPVVETSLTWLPPAQQTTTTLSPEKEPESKEPALTPPNLPLLKQWGQSVIRGIWISLGLLGTAAIADFVKWLISSLQR